MNTERYTTGDKKITIIAEYIAPEVVKLYAEMISLRIMFKDAIISQHQLVNLIERGDLIKI